MITIDSIVRGRFQSASVSYAAFAPDRARALSSSRQSVLSGEGKRAMDTIRSEVAQMQRAERGLLQERAAISRASARTATPRRFSSATRSRCARNSDSWICGASRTSSECS